MDEDKKPPTQFDASLPLPASDSGQRIDEPASGAATQKSDSNPAAELIRKKVAAAYETGLEPSPLQEQHDLQIDHVKATQLSKHQKFIMDLTSSGKPLHEIQTAWHEYYAGLPDGEKHEVWNEFYKAHSATTQTSAPHVAVHLHQPQYHHQNYQQPLTRTAHHPIRKKRANPLHSIMFGLGAGAIVLIIVLFSFFNERIIAPLIQPSRNASNIPIIGTTQISQTPELIIPKINVQIPVVYATDNSDNTIENDLESGVVHYADTAMPGQNGNLVIFGHSSNNIFNPGRYKFAFVLLSRLNGGDTFYIDNGGKRYTYQVYQKEIVSPSDVSVLGLTDKTATATLITCDPPGTSINRLVVTAEQIDPSPASNTAATTDNKVVSETSTLPSNAPTLWSRLVKWFEQ